MFIKNKINTVLLASLVFGLASCQDQKKEKISPEVIHRISPWKPPLFRGGGNGGFFKI